MITQQRIDIVFAALCAWREAQGEVEAGKIAVLCVIRNRVRKNWIHDSNFQDVCCHPWQFSAMTARGDPNLIKWPDSKDLAWLDCIRLAELIVTDRISDQTGGSEFYHDASISGPPAGWGSVEEQARIGRLVFYRGTKV